MIEYIRKIVKIQAVIRGKLARNYVLHLLDKIDSATFCKVYAWQISPEQTKEDAMGKGP